MLELHKNKKAGAAEMEEIYAFDPGYGLYDEIAEQEYAETLEVDSWTSDD